MLVDANLKEFTAPFVMEDIQHPPNIEAIWSDAELASIGLFRVKDEGPPPGHDIISSRVERSTEGGVIHMVYDTKPSAVQLPQSVTDKSFFVALRMGAHITDDEAVAAARGVIPAVVQNVVNTKSKDEQFQFRMDMAYDGEINRRSEGVDIFQEAYNISDTAMDELFVLAASL